MATSDYTLNLLKKFEGYTAKPKWDHKQYSVGYSTRWQPGSPVGTREDHEAALSREAGVIDSYLDKNVTAPLSDNQRAALTSFGFNLGPGAIGRLLPDINAGNWDNVAKRMLSFSRAGDNPNALTDRRQQEANILLGRDHPSSTATSDPQSPQSSPSQGSPDAPAQETNMLDFLAALGGSGNVMSALGKGLGMDNMTKAGGQNSIFGSLGAMFGGEGEDSAAGSPSAGGNAMGDANMRLAQNAMAGAAGGSGEDEKIPTAQRKPIDLSSLMKIIQQRGQLGIGGVRQPGAGLGA